MRGTSTRLGALSVAAAMAMTVLAGCGGDDEGRVELEFFQFKGEAVDTFDQIVADFEELHPDIDIVTTHGQGDTAFRIRLVREDYPDVITLNAGATWAENAPAGVFYDFSDEEIVDDINPAILEIINDLGVANEGEVNGLPFANNADGVIYNKDLFEQHGVEVPTTWDELLAAIETFEAAGVTPIYATLLEQWTSLPSWNALAANLPPEDFWEKLADDETSFQEDFPEVADRMYELFQHVQDDAFARNYNEGNTAFAAGDAAMYLQGSWAIPVIKSFEPGFDIGVFPLPMDSAEETNLVSGVDVAVTMAREPEHLEESMLFIEYLMSPEVQEFYVADQSAIPTLNDLEPSEEALRDVVPYFENEQLVGFADHKLPPAIPLPAINQTFLIDGDRDAYLGELDSEWDKVADRRPERLESQE
jgi:raffinose/stachyose/melibiose transport system substrate-binding protein